MIILVVRPRSWKELDSWSFGGGLLSSVQYILYLRLLSNSWKTSRNTGKDEQISANISARPSRVTCNKVSRLLIPKN